MTQPQEHKEKAYTGLFAEMSLVLDKNLNYDLSNTYAMRNFAIPTEATTEEYEEEEDSPYEEVRASVSNTDDPDMPVSTLRMWFIGLLLTILGAGMNTFFIFRNPYRLLVSYAILYVPNPLCQPTFC